MSWAHPKSFLGQAALFGVLLVLAATTLFARRPQVGWRADLSRDQIDRRKLAAYALRESPQDKVAGALSHLMVAANDADPELAAIAKESLHRLAPRVAGVLAQTAAHSGGPHAAEALELLASGGPAAARAISKEVLRSPAPAARLAGLKALEQLGTDAKGELQAIERLIGDPELEVRRQALRTLRTIDAASPELFRAAQRATRDTDATLRDRAWRALALSPLLLERARDPEVAPGLAAELEKNLPGLSPELRRALDEGLGRN